jgi:Flp pilus assembly protein TadD
MAAVALVALVGFLPSLIAEQLTTSSYQASPGQAATLARSATDFAPFSADAELAVAHAELRRGNEAAALAAARAATSREPRNWFAWLSLADIAARGHDPAAIATACGKATALNPTLRCPAPST